MALRVSDLDASLGFYKEFVGIPLHGDSDNTHQEYSWHGPYFHFSLFPAMSGEPPTKSRVGFATEDVRAVHEKALDLGIPIIQPPADQLRDWMQPTAILMVTR